MDGMVWAYLQYLFIVILPPEMRIVNRLLFHHLNLQFAKPDVPLSRFGVKGFDGTSEPFVIVQITDLVRDLFQIPEFAFALFLDHKAYNVSAKSPGRKVEHNVLLLMGEFSTHLRDIKIIQSSQKL